MSQGRQYFAAKGNWRLSIRRNALIAWAQELANISRAGMRGIRGVVRQTISTKLPYFPLTRVLPRLVRLGGAQSDVNGRGFQRTIVDVPIYSFWLSL